MKRRKANRRILGVSIVSGLTIASGIAIASTIGSVSAVDNTGANETWGPIRPTYTWDHPADHVTFNSITDNPSLGDERNFVRVRKAGTKDKYSDNVDIEIGQEYEVYVYYHNNASSTLNDKAHDRKGIASNVRLRAEIPEKLKANEAAMVKGTITSDGDPDSVWDTAYLHAKDTVYLRYVPNSATIHNGNKDDDSANGTILNGEALFSSNGVALAYWNTDWGLIPGCNEYAGYVTYRVKADQPKFYMEKNVSMDNKSFADTISTKMGETLTFKISYKNTGTTAQSNVTVHDKMPEGLEYIAGSTHVTSTADPEGVDAPDSLFGDGLGIGTFQPGEEATITYKAKISANEDVIACGANVKYNDAWIVTENGTEYDKVKITVNRDCTPPEMPKTGPAEIALAISVVLAMGIGGFYLYRSNKALSQVEFKAKGGKSSKK